MGSPDRAREAIRRILTEIAAIPYSHGRLQSTTVFDRDRYLVVSQGWDGIRRIHHVIAHIDTIDDKV